MALNQIEILVVHGPNLNLLGTREVNIYGSTTLNDINGQLQKWGESLNLKLEFFQSNFEGEIIEKIQTTKTHGILINPASLTHTSIAIRDALLAVQKPVVEVHLSNIFAREHFRQISLISDISIGIIAGFGAKSYEYGLQALFDYLQKNL